MKKASIVIKFTIEAENRQDAEVKLNNLCLQIFSVYRGTDLVVMAEQAFKELPEDGERIPP